MKRMNGTIRYRQRLRKDQHQDGQSASSTEEDEKA